jgi:hypothetical protein
MKNEKELNEDILNITMKIRNQSPELSKYIMEMPVTIPNTEDPKINIKILQDYCESLKVLLKNYTENNKLPLK